MVILTDTRQKKRDMCYMVSLTCGILIRKQIQYAVSYKTETNSGTQKTRRKGSGEGLN